VAFVEERLNQLPEPPTSKASAPDSKVRVLLAAAGYRRRSTRILTDLQAAFDERRIICHPKIDDPRNTRDTRVYFFTKLPGDLVHDSELFPKEEQLEHFIEVNYRLLTPFQNLDLLKRQFQLGPEKKIDLMFKDRKNNDLVGVELKKGEPDDRTVQQISVYFRALQAEAKREGCGFRLVLITGQPHPDIERSLRELTDDRFELWRYAVKLDVTKSNVGV